MKTWAWVAVGVMAFATVAVVISMSGSKDESPSANPDASASPTPSATSTTPEPRAKWDAGVLATKVVDPATVRVTYLVKNTGDAPGRPVCKMTVRDRPGNYTGFEISTAMEPIKPGKFARFSVLITVKNEGARYATYTKVKCKTA